MSTNKTKSKAGVWSRAKISTLSIILLIMMAGAGIFFTTAFSILHSLLDDTLTYWQHVQQLLSQTSINLPAAYATDSAHVTESLQFLKTLTIIFIVAVLLSVGAFFILMYSTLMIKIVKPIKQMEKGILDITSTNDFSKVLDAKYQDEVGQVIQCFNGLTGDLKTIFDRLITT